MTIYYTSKDWDIVVTVEAEDEWASFPMVDGIIPKEIGFYKNPEHKNVKDKKHVTLTEYRRISSIRSKR